MAKYSIELKLKVVQDYLVGTGGYQFLADKYHLKRFEIIRDWVKAYQEFGPAGLQRKRQNTAYTTQFKLNAVNLYLTSEKTYRELATELGINNPPLLTRWVTDYREKGELAFSKARGKPRNESELPQNKQAKQSSNINEIEQELAQLQNEVLNLRMENEYLKGLRRLRQEQHKRENPEWSASSDENSSSRSRNS